jgi:SAM-dependent MidA family methyltransferase
MAERAMRPGLLPSDENGELADDQAAGRGGASGKLRRARSLNLSKGRSRNLVIPDELFDAIAVHAVVTKTTDKDKRGRPYTRSLNVSEAVCLAIKSYLARVAADDSRGRRPADAQ